MKIKFQNAIRDCMAERGFEYIPVTPDIDPTGGVSRLELRRKFGYGVSTGTGLTDMPDMSDPNSAIVAGLSAAEEAAYGSALTGSPVSFISIIGQDGTSIQYDPGACASVAFATGLGIDRAEATKVQLRYELLLQDLEVQIASDQRGLAAQDAWSQCMKSHGYDVADRASLIKMIEQMLDSDSKEKVLEFELIAASTDVECDIEAEFGLTMYRIRLAYEGVFIENHPDLADAIG